MMECNCFKASDEFSFLKSRELSKVMLEKEGETTSILTKYPLQQIYQLKPATSIGHSLIHLKKQRIRSHFL